MQVTENKQHANATTDENPITGYDQGALRVGTAILGATQVNEPGQPWADSASMSDYDQQALRVGTVILGATQRAGPKELATAVGIAVPRRNEAWIPETAPAGDEGTVAYEGETAALVAKRRVVDKEHEEALDDYWQASAAVLYNFGVLALPEDIKLLVDVVDVDPARLALCGVAPKLTRVACPPPGEPPPDRSGSAWPHEHAIRGWRTRERLLPAKSGSSTVGYSSSRHPGSGAA